MSYFVAIKQVPPVWVDGLKTTHVDSPHEQQGLASDMIFDMNGPQWPWPFFSVYELHIGNGTGDGGHGSRAKVGTTSLYHIGSPGMIREV